MNYTLTVGRDNSDTKVVSDPMPFYAAQEIYARMVQVASDELHGVEGMSWTGHIRMGAAPNTRALHVTIDPVKE